MRAIAAFQISIIRFGIWRSAVLSLAALVTLSMLAWALYRAMGSGRRRIGSDRRTLARRVAGRAYAIQPALGRAALASRDYRFAWP
jgi:hypothetical protein